MRLPCYYESGLTNVSAGPRGLLLQMKKHFAGFWHQQHAFVFAICEIIWIDALWIAVAEVYFFAGRFGNSGCECHTRARTFDSIFESAETVHVS